MKRTQQPQDIQSQILNFWSVFNQSVMVAALVFIGLAPIFITQNLSLLITTYILSNLFILALPSLINLAKGSANLYDLIWATTMTIIAASYIFNFPLLSLFTFLPTFYMVTIAMPIIVCSVACSLIAAQVAPLANEKTLILITVVCALLFGITALPPFSPILPTIVAYIASTTINALSFLPVLFAVFNVITGTLAASGILISFLSILYYLKQSPTPLMKKFCGYGLALGLCMTVFPGFIVTALTAVISIIPAISVPLVLLNPYVVLSLLFVATLSPMIPSIMDRLLLILPKVGLAQNTLKSLFPSLNRIQPKIHRHSNNRLHQNSNSPLHNFPQNKRNLIPKVMHGMGVKPQNKSFFSSKR